MVAECSDVGPRDAIDISNKHQYYASQRLLAFSCFALRSGRASLRVPEPHVRSSPASVTTSAQEGHLEEVKALLEAGKRELVMLSKDHGHLDAVRALLEVGRREFAMMTRNDAVSCLWISSLKGHPGVVKALLGGRGAHLYV